MHIFSPAFFADVLPAIPAWRRAWATRDGCSPTVAPVISHPYTSTTVDEWHCSSPADVEDDGEGDDDDGGATAVVKGYAIEGLGHHWPRIHEPKGEPATFDATKDDIVPFFEAHPL